MLQAHESEGILVIREKSEHVYNEIRNLEEEIVYHTCKSRSCPSCAQRATLLWQREQWSALPDIPYTGIGLTMPDVLWPIFRQNRQLLHDLPALASAVIQQWVKAKYGVRVLIVVVPHTFGRHLNFNAHLHVMVSAGGLKESEVCWTAPLQFNRGKLMRMWRYAVITYLRAALKKGLLVSEASTEELRVMLETQYERWWNVYVDPIKSNGISCDMWRATFDDHRLPSIDSRRSRIEKSSF